MNCLVYLQFFVACHMQTLALISSQYILTTKHLVLYKLVIGNCYECIHLDI